MQNEKITRMYQISFLFFTLTALIMFSGNMEHMQRVYGLQNEAKTSTGLLESKEDRKEDLLTTIQAIGIPKVSATATDVAKSAKTSIHLPIECDQNCKLQVLVQAGINSNLAKEMVSVCKELAKDPVHCIKYASSVSSAESGGGKKCYKNNCFGIKSGTIGFETLNKGVIDWVTRYNKYWWKATSMSQFYSQKGKLPYFRYCTSEYSSNSKIGCPFGLKHAQNMFNKLDKSF